MDGLHIFVLTVIGFMAVPAIWSMTAYSIKNRNTPKKNRDKYYRN